MIYPILNFQKILLILISIYIFLINFYHWDYHRIRVGVSRPSKIYEKLNQENISKWVLSDFTSNEEINWLNKTLDRITDEINLLITNQIESLNFK